MSDDDLFGVTVAATYANAQRNGLTWRLVPGTVISGGTVTNIPVLLDGDTSDTIRAQSLTGVFNTGDRVMVMVVPPQGNYIIGSYGAPPTSFVDEIVRTSSVGPFTTTEQLLDQITFTSPSSLLRWKLTWVGTIQSSVAGDGMRLRLRWEEGTTLTSSGVLFNQKEVNSDVINKGMPLTIVKTVTGLIGEVSIGVLGVRGSGSGNLTSFADSAREISTLLEVY